MPIIKLPLNQAIQKKYAIAADELVYSSNLQPYEGPYYELNNRKFVGETFNSDAPELSHIYNIQKNSLLSNPETEAYGKISNMVINTFTIKSVPFSPSNEQIQVGFMTRYFAKKITSSNIIDIKEINQDLFKILFNDPLYQVLKIKYNFAATTEEELNNFDKQMLGLKQYILDTSELITSSDESQAAEDEFNGKFPTFIYSK